MIRILHVLGSLNRGGSETLAMNLYRKIDRTKVQFDFVKHLSQKCAYEDEITSMGGKIYLAPRYKIYNHFSYCRWWIEFLQEHPEYKIVHGHYFTIASVFFKIAKKFGCKTIAHSHHTPPKKIFSNVINRLYTRNLEHYSDYGFACSQNAGEWIFKKMPFSVLNNAIDSGQYVFSEENRKQIRKEFHLEGKFVVGNVGGLRPPKNQSFLIDVFAKVHQKKSDAVLMIVGSGSLENALSEKVSKMGLAEFVIFTGSRPDIPALLSAMDVFVFPSLWEGLGIAAIEAQASGLHVICSDVLPKETKVTDLIEYKSLSDSAGVWADSVMKYAESYERQNMQQYIVDAKYDINAVANWLQNFYLKIL